MDQPQRTTRELTLYIVLFITAFAILGAMLFILRSGNQMIATIQPLADASMEIGIDASQAHLWLMEAALDPEHQHFDTAQYFLQRADRWVNAMLNGGMVGSTRVSRLEDEEMRSRVTDIKTSIVHLLSIGEHELPELLDEHMHRANKHRHDALFTGLLDQTVALETQLRQIIVSEHRHFRQVQITLITICVGFFVLVTAVLSRHLRARKRYEHRISRLNLILRAVRNVNHLITREKDRGRLIRTTCELLVEDRGFLNAWITLIDQSGKPTIQAEAGLSENFAPALQRLQNGELLPCCRKSLEHEGVFVINDPHLDCPDCPLSEMYTGRSGLAVKLRHGTRIYGFMVVSSPRNYAFDTEEHSLFAELAEDIALSLHLLKVEEERIQAEQARRESEDRYRTLAANIPNIDIYLFDRDMRYLVAEGSEMRTNNLSSSDYEGKHVSEAWDEHLCAILEPMYQKALQGETGTCEYRCCNKFYSLTAVPVYNGGREVVGGIALTQNITERKRSERALRLTRFSIDHAADGVFWCASNGQFLDTNPAATKLLGYTREDFMKMRVWDIDPEFPPKKFKEQFQACHNAGALTFHTHLRARTGRLVPVEIQSNYVEFEGQEYICSFIRDITERRRTEEAIKRSESILRHTFEAIPDLISVHDSDFNVVMSNWHRRQEAHVRYLEGCVKCYAAYMDSERPCNPCHARKVFETKEPLKIEKTDQSDGSTREINIYPILGDDGGVSMVTEHVRDITEQRRAERLQSTLLKISEATNLTPHLDELLGVIHHALGGLIDTTNFYVALYDERKNCYTFPYSVDEYDGTDFTPSELRKSLTDYVRRTGRPLLADESVHGKLQKLGEITLIGTPSKIWLGVPLTTSHGVIGVVVVQSYTNPHLYGESDKELLTLVSGHITMAVERKLAEEALRKSEERLRAMYEQASVGVALISLDGRWRVVNERLCQILGYSRDELLRLSCHDVTHADDHNNPACIIHQVRQDRNGKCSCEKRYLRKNGETVWVNVSAAVVREPTDEEECFVAIIQDISERKSAEGMVTRYTEQLITANRALEAKQAELEEFIYTVSHDLKAPIVSISGFAGLVKEKLGGDIDQASARQLDRILYNATVMEQLIGDLLELSRIGRAEEPLCAIDFEQLTDEIFESLSVTAASRNITLKKTRYLPATTGHYQRVRQLVTNLVDNAIKYMPDKKSGAVVEVGFTAEAPNGQSILPAYYVRDNGEGIPPEFHDRIFNMFQRAVNSASRSTGTGIGLAIVKRIVQKHGGHVWLTSEIGQGTTFYFTLPATRMSDGPGVKGTDAQTEMKPLGAEWKP